MVYLKKIGLLIIFAVITFNCLGNDTLNIAPFYSIEYLINENPWLNSNNPSGLVFNKNRNLFTLKTGSFNQEGDFHRTQESGDINRYFLESESYQQVNERFFVAGRFAYNNYKEKGSRWVGTYEPYRGNPYIIGDSIANSAYRKESYSLNGQFAYNLSERICLGAEFDYLAANGAKRKDPRPENTVTSFTANPSLLFMFRKFNLGINVGFKNRKEEISYIVLRSNLSPTFFMFKGFGLYSIDIGSSFYRFQSENQWFGGLQLEKEFNKVTSFSQIKMNYSIERIEDGTSSIRRDQGGDWITYKFEFTESLKWKNTNHSHIINGTVSYFNGDGIEYTQKSDPKNSSIPYYVTVSKYKKYNRNELFALLDYRFIRFISPGQTDWDINSSVSYNSNNEKYYFTPETFEASYSNITAHASVRKSLYWAKFHFSPRIEASYRYNTENSNDYAILSGITKRQRTDIALYDFEYYTSDLFDIKCVLQFGRFTPNYKTFKQINLGLTCGYINPVDTAADLFHLGVECNIVF